MPHRGRLRAAASRSKAGPRRSGSAWHTIGPRGAG